jgi:hypothetical protein
MSNPNYYIIRQVPGDYHLQLVATTQLQGVIDMKVVGNWEVIAVLINQKPTYQNYIFKIADDIYFWADPSDEYTVDMLIAVGVPQWKDKLVEHHMRVVIQP